MHNYAGGRSKHFGFHPAFEYICTATTLRRRFLPRMLITGALHNMVSPLASSCSEARNRRPMLQQLLPKQCRRCCTVPPNKERKADSSILQLQKTNNPERFPGLARFGSRGAGGGREGRQISPQAGNTNSKPCIHTPQKQSRERSSVHCRKEHKQP